MKTFAEYGISIPSNAAGPEVQTTCAQCSRERRKKNARCLSVNIDKMVWICHHCGGSGSLQGADHRPSEPQHWRKPKYRTLEPRPQVALPQNAADWFRLRGITDAVLIRNRVGYDRVYFPQIEDHTEALIFPYFRNGTILNRKYRSVHDKHFRLEVGCELILYGEFTAVTGIPSSGKSNWLDCLLVNLARLHGWNFALFSPENLPLEQHMAAIAEKFSGKPFHVGPTPRMTRQELEPALNWVNEHFTWIMPSSEDEWTVDKILAIAGQLCLRRGIRGLVIDPWNELEALRPSGMTETEYVSHCLKRMRVFARQRGIHLWIVIHPSKLYRNESGRYPIPSLYDCAGSAHWRNKADNGIVVWRDLSEDDSAEVQIHVQKIRYAQIGRRGIASLYYEPICATYTDYEPRHQHKALDKTDLHSVDYQSVLDMSSGRKVLKH